VSGHAFGWLQAPGVMNFGVNWQSPGVVQTAATSTGAANIFTDATNTPGFVDMAAKDYRLTATSTALNHTGTLAPAVTSNTLGLNLTPAFQYVAGGSPESRSDLTAPGAFAFHSPLIQ